MCRPDSCPTASPPLPGPTADEGFCQPVVLLSSAARQGMIYQQAWFLHRMNEVEGKETGTHFRATLRALRASC